MPTVRVGQINMHCEVLGQGEPLVMIPGLGIGSGTCFFRQIAGLAQEYRVIAIDNRGSGLSDKPDAPYSMEMMADDAAGLLAALGIDRAHIYGISMGGMIAQHLALRHPEAAASLVLACTSSGGRLAEPPDEEYVLSVFNTEGTAEARLRGRLHFLFTDSFIRSNPGAIEDYVRMHLDSMPPFHTYVRQAEAVIMHDTYDQLPGLGLPTLVIAGEADRTQPVRNSRILASRIPNAELVVMGGLRHFLSIECPEDLNRTMVEFLKRHPCTH
jgi:pimeloyl-ACP methyl ester carboxylesterase